MEQSNTIQGFLVLTLASMFTLGCPASSQYVRVPLEEARALNSQVSAFYAGTRDLVENTNRQVGVIGDLPGGIRPQDFEVQLVKNALISCFNEPISITEVTNEAPRGVTAEPGRDPLRPLTARPDLGNVASCNPREMISLESYLEYTPDNISGFIMARVLMVDSLRVNLKHVLQERLNRLEERVQDADVDVVRLRNTASERYEQTMTSDNASAEQRLQTEADFENIQAELDDIETLLVSIRGDLTELRRFRRQLVEDVAVNLTSMGNSNQ